MTKSDVIIIGAGAAGLSAGLYASRSGIDAIIIDQSQIGGQIAQIDSLENYPGFFPAQDGVSFIEQLKEQAMYFGTKIIKDTVISIDKKNQDFIVKATKDTYNSKALIYATGATHNHLNIPGEKEFFARGVSYCAICDGPFFKDREICVVGGGDSAASEALYLSKIAKKVNLIHRRNKLKCQKTLTERIKNTPNIELYLNTTVEQILGDKTVTSIQAKQTNGTTQDTLNLPCSAVFIFVGMSPQVSLLDTLPKDEGGYLITNEKMQTAIPGLFIAGDVRSKPLRQIITATSDGSIAGFFAAEYINELGTKS
ncbi:MAG: thioredoxin-disulfide reductase [Treponema sp.]|nr:thioredoxin-disulfide reductase [Treponema sp.]